MKDQYKKYCEECGIENPTILMKGKWLCLKCWRDRKFTKKGPGKVTGCNQNQGYSTMDDSSSRAP